MERVQWAVEEWVATLGAKVTNRLFVAVDSVMRAMRSVSTLVTSFKNRARVGHRRLQEALQERENRLTKLLADSSEAMIVTDDAHRVLDANLAGLALLGVSKTNIHKFTVDAFLRSNQTHLFERGVPPFLRGAARAGKCEINGLDGKSQVVGFVFQPNFVLGRHLTKFQHMPSRQS
jgi:PAS domain-containing protein